jgi:hypothetical protein
VPEPLGGIAVGHDPLFDGDRSADTPKDRGISPKSMSSSSEDSMRDSLPRHADRLLPLTTTALPLLPAIDRTAEDAAAGLGLDKAAEGDAALAAKHVARRTDFKAAMVLAVVHEAATVANEGHYGLEEIRGLCGKRWKGRRIGGRRVRRLGLAIPNSKATADRVGSPGAGRLRLRFKHAACCDNRHVRPDRHCYILVRRLSCVAKRRHDRHPGESP